VSPPQILAYLDLERGCMPRTEQMLQNAAVEYEDDLDIRVLDITERPKGRDDGSGPAVPAIHFGGSHTVTWTAHAGPPRVVRFTLPPGYYWQRRDLQAAMEALAKGQLRAATEDEIRGLQTLSPPRIEVAGQTLKKGDQPPVGQVIINGKVAVELPRTADHEDPGRRVRAAVGALKAWTRDWYSPAELSVQARDEAAVLQADDSAVLTATSADAEKAGVATPEDLAHRWMQAVADPMLCPGR
jgi:hypothetical protein